MYIIHARRCNIDLFTKMLFEKIGVMKEDVAVGMCRQSYEIVTYNAYILICIPYERNDVVTIYVYPLAIWS